MLQKVLGRFRKSEPLAVVPLRVADIDARIGGTQSKRARIRGVLRRYEQGGIKEAAAVEELLRILR